MADNIVRITIRVPDQMIKRWQTVHEFSDGDVHVEIASIVEAYSPPYSLRVVHDRGPWFAYMADSDKTYAERIATLVDRAEVWILDRQAARIAELEREESARKVALKVGVR